MNQILILGAGLVAGPLVEYLHKEGFKITLASQFLHEAEKLGKGRQGITPIALNVAVDESLDKAVSNHLITVSFLPFALHQAVAEKCLKYKRHMVTASYRTKQMSDLNNAAKTAGITLLNEMGFDPGLDHLSAMSVINEVQKAGGKIDSFVSWGAGLPDIQYDNNPFHYKFSWAPKSVLLALKNDAEFLLDGEQITVPSSQLLNNVLSAWTDESVNFEGYPNRNSVPYKKAYGLKHAKTVLRGTLRYQGHLDIMREARDIGLLSDTPVKTQASNWREYLQELSLANTENLEDKLNLSKDVKSAFQWAGMLSTETPLGDGQTPIDKYCQLLQEKLVFAEGEQDLSLLIHKFAITHANGEKEHRISKLKVVGDANGFTAMSKTVGTPAAIATKLILDGKLCERGSIIPVGEEYYTNMLPLLAEEGLSCVESSIPLSENNFFRELNS